MKLPSIELLSTVLNIDIELIEKEDNLIIYTSHHCPNPLYDKSINIYEFSEKCRKWAKEQSYILMIFGSVVYIVPDNFDADYFKFLNYKSFSEKTINESIFAACEWILTKDK